MENFRQALSKHSKIVGLKWTKLESKPKKGDGESPVTRSMKRRIDLTENNNYSTTRKETRTLKRAQSVREAFGSLRQKLRVSTRRKKRLVNVDSPLATMTNRTPASQRRSALKAHKLDHFDVKMYSPFTIDTPGTRTTPRAIRMGIHHPKRFNFTTSPGQVTRDVNALADGIQALTSNSCHLNEAIEGMTPMRDIVGERTRHPITSARRSSPRSRMTPIFV